MLIDIVVTVVDLVFQDADDLVRDAVQADAFADRLLAGKQLLLGVRSDEGDAGVGEVLGLAEEAAFSHFHAAHAGIDGVNAADAVVGAARAVGYSCIA